MTPVCMHAWVCSKLVSRFCRSYHPHVVSVVDRLIEGIRSKGPGELIDMSNVAQARASCLLPLRCAQA